MYNKINENLFKSWFSTCKKKLLSVISCHCPELAICTDLFNRDTLITPYRKFSLNCKKHSKTEKNMFKLNVFLIRFLPYLYTARIWLTLLHQRLSEAAVRRCFTKQVSWKFCKIHRTTPILESLFNKVAHMLSYDLCEIFKNIYFPITTQNQTMLLTKQISKVK